MSDARRVLVFIVLSIGLLFIWERYFSKNNIQQDNSTSNSILSTTSNEITNAEQNKNVTANNLNVTVTTDLYQATISSLGATLTELSLLKYSQNNNFKQSFKILQDTENSKFIAQSGLIDKSKILPQYNTVFQVDKTNYVMDLDKNELVVDFTYDTGTIKVIKSYVFKRNSYVIGINYKIINNSIYDLENVSAYYRFLRDKEEPSGENKLVHTFTGPVYFDSENKFNTIKFSKINNNFDLLENVKNGYAGIIQHYFASLWLLNSYQSNNICTNGVRCRLSIKGTDNDLVSVGVLTDLPNINHNNKFAISIPLFIGPQEYSTLLNTAPSMDLTKDYGWVYIFATPLFWLLVKIFTFVKNWGIAIILLTIFVKIVLYPLTRASYISMAKMKVLAPKVELIKSKYKDNKLGFQKELMDLYKRERVNPIGGCLPMLLQIPVFIGLYWALLSSVELRQAKFLWVNDLSSSDPYFILPIILAITMFVQTYLNPPVTDPMQAKMMRIMPIMFSVMFFFFPAGLVLYWLINNVLSMAQQWYINSHITLKKIDRK